MDQEIAKKIKQLRKETGCRFLDCYKAVLYCEEHKECLPLAYLRAIYFPFNEEDFDERVKQETKYI